MVEPPRFPEKPDRHPACGSEVTKDLSGSSDLFEAFRIIHVSCTGITLVVTTVHTMDFSFPCSMHCSLLYTTPTLSVGCAPSPVFIEPIALFILSYRSRVWVVKILITYQPAQPTHSLSIDQILCLTPHVSLLSISFFLFLPDHL